MTVPLYNLTDTWNNGATVFTAIKMNVTDTASDPTSLLLDLQVAGGSKFNVDKGGTTSAFVFSAGTFSLPVPSGTGYVQASGFGINYGVYGVTNFTLFQNETDILQPVRFVNTYLGFTTGGSPDVLLGRDGAGIIAISNSTSATTLRVYNTFTDTSNYERGVFDWTTTANTLTIGTQKLGSGSARGVSLISQAALLLSAVTSNITISSSVGTIGLSSAAPVSIDTCLSFPSGSTPATPVTASTYTQTGSDVYITFNASGTCTLTLFSPTSSHAMSFLFVRTIANQAVVSASSNIVPLAGGSAGTAILPATAGKWAMLVADGSAAWQIIAAN